jgi:hypothetical protein
MQKNLISTFLLAILALPAISQIYQGSINTRNTQGVQTDATSKLQWSRDSWCNVTTPDDRNYNASMKFYYRSTRSNFLGYHVVSVVNYLKDGDAQKLINTMKWPFALLLTVLLIVFLSWLSFLVFICFGKKERKNDLALSSCLKLARLFLFFFNGLFIIIIIFIAFSEVAQRHTKCQILNVGNMIVNGYVSNINGNQYVGLTAINQAILNFKADSVNAVNVAVQANAVWNANYPSAALNAIAALEAIAGNYSSATTLNHFGQADKPNSIRNMNEYVSPAAKVEFLDLMSVANTTNNAALAVIEVVNNNLLANGNGFIDGTVRSLNAFFTSLANDVVLLTNSVYDQVTDRYVYATGGYWAIFAISLIIGALAKYLLKKLTDIKDDSGAERNFKILKIVLAVLGFFLFWYGILTLILLAGSASISSFCTILGQVNQGNTNFLDSLNLNYPGNSKLVLKECLVGKTGNLWNIFSVWPTSNNVTFALQIQNLITGSLNFRGYYANSQIKGPSSLAVLASQYAAISNGILADFTGVSDQFNLFYNANPVASTGTVVSLTNSNCTALPSGQTCLPIDRTLLQNLNIPNTKYQNLQIYFNLQQYILSEQALLQQIVSNLLQRTDIQTPGSLFRNFKVSLDQNALAMQGILNHFSSTLSPFSQYQGMGVYLNDCRNVRRELDVLEDHYCFELNYWVNILTIIASVSFLVLFILAWAFCAVIREADTDTEVNNFPSQGRDNRLDINEREIIPNA